MFSDFLMAYVFPFYVCFPLFSSCEFVSCHKQPNYGYEGERARFCSTHKLATMVDVKHRSGLINYRVVPANICVVY